MQRTVDGMFIPIEVCAIVYAVLLFLIPPYLIGAIVVGFKIHTLLNFLVVAALIYRVFLVRTGRGLAMPLPAVVLTLAVVGTWAAIVASALGHTYAPLFTMRSLLEGELVPNALAFTIFAVCGARPGFVRRYAAALMIAGLVVVAVEAIEVLHQKNPFAVAASDSVAGVQDNMRNGAYRAFSTTAHPLVLAELLSFTIAAAMLVVASYGGRGRIVGLAAICAFIVGEHFTNTRSSTALIVMSIGLFRVGTTLSAQIRRQGIAKLTAWSILSLPLLVVIVFFVLPTLVDLVTEYFGGATQAEITSTQGRIQMIEQGLNLIMTRPFGYGYGQAIPLVGLAAGDHLTLDNYLLFMTLNSGIQALLLLVTAVLLTSVYSVTSKVSAVSGSDAVGAFMFTVPFLWLFCSYAQTIWDMHYIFYSCAGIVVSHMAVTPANSQVPQSISAI